MQQSQLSLGPKPNYLLRTYPYLYIGGPERFPKEFHISEQEIENCKASFHRNESLHSIILILLRKPDILGHGKIYERSLKSEHHPTLDALECPIPMLDFRVTVEILETSKHHT